MKLELNIVKYRVLCLCISAAFLIPCIGSLIYNSITTDTHTPVKVSIDYTGGTILQYGVKDEIDTNQLGILRNALAKNGIQNPELQIINVNNNENSAIKSLISIRTKFINNDSDDEANITKTVQSQFKDARLDQVSSVGPTLGKELFANSLFAVVLALIGIICYLSFRFQFDYALAAILGLVHDVIFVLGIFALLKIEVDALFVTALLTVIGFSVHDTIVVFDRVRENLRYYAKKMSFSEIINFSINQTLARSINTSVTTLLTLFALYFFGGVTTRNFVLAMILGIAIGTYSSIFFCSVLVDIWNEKKYVSLGSAKKA